jgi:hypothetical protein
VSKSQHGNLGPTHAPKGGKRLGKMGADFASTQSRPGVDAPPKRGKSPVKKFEPTATVVPTDMGERSIGGAKSGSQPKVYGGGRRLQPAFGNKSKRRKGSSGSGVQGAI